MVVYGRRAAGGNGGVELNRIYIPQEFSEEVRLPPKAKWVYTALLMYQPSSLARLAKIVDCDRTTVTRLCCQMEGLGWVKMAREGYRYLPLPTMPHEVEVKLAQKVRLELSMSGFRCESVTKEILSFLIDSDDYVDNARPSFLINPETKRRLEIDRYYYRLKKGWDYNGEQHYGPTSWYSEKEHRDVRKRDLMKMGLSVETGFELIIVRREDLSLEGILAKMPAGMPLRRVDLNGPYASMLQDVAEAARTSTDPDRSGDTRR